ncbi:hypothetical protein HXX76_006346 [Chlamydomonas incerta]|uniref:Uncharacterized protein n=1 Tax=Chlamydomonas incerta TaxID=51695 RepID=A0A835T0Y9_CHLIN|nr:hypothetical protein HXX76_006346 [Chlamydomonas incerta]|eukprot:KAG2436824.1 hypothetical protein HXX76_006346 [Chlamydomonas incerta]
MAGLAAGDAGQAAALQRLLRECEALDATIRRLHKEAPAAMSLGLATADSSTGDMEAGAAAARTCGAAGPGSGASSDGMRASVANRGGQGLWQRGLCFDDVEEAWREGGHAEWSSARGGLLTCRRVVEPRQHWWAWLPC